MKSHYPSRLGLGAAFLVLFAITPAFARGGGQKQKSAPPPPAVRQYNRPVQPRVNGPNPGGPNAGGPNAGVRAAQNQEHLQQWMENHKNLSPADQRRALQNEPGFRELPPQTQQRYLNQLDRLNSMKPQVRDRTLQQNEILEHMPPAQAQQYRAAAQALTAAPQDRRRLMARAILDLREMPPAQREQVISSPRFGAQFSDGERSTIRTLLTAEPYPPIAAP
jgi:hypothetical protein